ncbi:SDR family NAD(P)-dependent oxidoreductase [Bacillus taeanensis]|uniref:Oxidoreductase n=1 Tax=Bacillus taeanensis TaxID=273032 RepID=A0A366Y2F3_9BACI|nr:SDR family oxidoreductase [Bacillus taeanensis]RBW70391.1 oxidoreductase [Bacillus taeanensis]
MRNKHSLKNQIVAVTGASRGVGKQIAIDVARFEGIPLLIARSAEKLKEVQQEIKDQTNIEAPIYIGDIGNYEDVHRVFKNIDEKFPHIDVLINNAGFGIFDMFKDAKLKDIENMFQVNVFGMMYCTKQVLPKMIAQNKGHIINISSQAGKLATPKSSGYAASKHAVLGFSNSLRLELKKTNIFVTTVNPGPMKTSFFEIADQSGSYMKNIEKYMLSPAVVAREIVKTIEKPKREINLPKWMEAGSKLYQLMPSVVEKVAGQAFYKK